MPGFLAGCRALTREACALDLRQVTTWCRARSFALFAARRFAGERDLAGWRSRGSDFIQARSLTAIPA